MIFTLARLVTACEDYLLEQDVDTACQNITKTLAWYLRSVIFVKEKRQGQEHQGRVTTDNFLLSDTHHDERTACQVKSILLQLRPCLARNAFELGVGLLPVPCLVPGLNAKGRDAEFGSGQVLWRSQHIHSRGGQPDTRCLARRKINERDPADPGSPQRKRQRAAALSASDYSHVVIDPLPIGHPVLWVGAKQPESLASIRIRIGHR